MKDSWWISSRNNLRVVQIQAILFLKSMSEKVGSDKERLWNWTSWSTKNRKKIQFQSRYMSDPPLSAIDFKNKMVWSELPLIQLECYSTKRLFQSEGQAKYSPAVVVLFAECGKCLICLIIYSRSNNLIELFHLAKKEIHLWLLYFIPSRTGLRHNRLEIIYV